MPVERREQIIAASDVGCSLKTDRNRSVVEAVGPQRT
jgi:hypothetical protein